jgi:hypothetical protein
MPKYENNQNIALQNSNKKAYEHINLSMKRNYELPNLPLKNS